QRACLGQPGVVVAPSTRPVKTQGASRIDSKFRSCRSRDDPWSYPVVQRVPTRCLPLCPPCLADPLNSGNTSGRRPIGGDDRQPPQVCSLLSATPSILESLCPTPVHKQLPAWSRDESSAGTCPPERLASSDPASLIGSADRPIWRRFRMSPNGSI